MTGPERLDHRPEGGFIITGKCGRPHLVGHNWSWWQCHHCRAWRTRRLRDEHAAQMALLYPDTDPDPGPVRDPRSWVCQWCGCGFDTRWGAQRFCTPECYRAWDSATQRARYQAKRGTR